VSAANDLFCGRNGEAADRVLKTTRGAPMEACRRRAEETLTANIVQGLMAVNCYNGMEKDDNVLKLRVKRVL